MFVEAALNRYDPGAGAVVWLGEAGAHSKSMTHGYTAERNIVAVDGMRPVR